MELEHKIGNKVEITKPLLFTLILFGVLGVVGAYLYLTDSVAYKHKPPSGDYECKIEIAKDVKNKFIVFEDGVCGSYIDYKNLPNDTTVYGRNDGSLKDVKIGQ